MVNRYIVYCLVAINTFVFACLLPAYAQGQAPIDPANSAYFDMLEDLYQKQNRYIQRLKLGGQWLYKPSGARVGVFKPNERSKVIWTRVIGRLGRRGKSLTNTKSYYHYHVVAPPNFSDYELAIFDMAGNMLTRSFAQDGVANVTLKDVKYSQRVAIQITVLAKSHKGGIFRFSPFYYYHPNFFGQATTSGPVSDIQS